MNIQDKFILPVIVNPLIRCYRIHAYMINLMEQSYPDFILYIFSNYLNLHNNDANYPLNYLDFNLDNNFLDIENVFRNNNFFDIVQIHIFDNNIFNNCSEIKDLMIEWLCKGYYILQVANEACYKNNFSHNHDNIVLTHGYDKVNNTFYLLHYDSEGLFVSSNIQTDQYLNSLVTVTHLNRINFIKARKELEFKFELERSLHLIQCYINSQNAYPDHEDFKQHIFGYESVELTLRKMRDRDFNIINIRTILEHKKILRKYIQYLYDNKYIGDHSICLEYKNIEKSMELIFNKMIKKMILLESDGQYKNEMDEILHLNENEVKILKKLL